MFKKSGFIKSAGLMHNRRAQGLPMNTIILIILVLFVLAGVGVFFFTQFSAGETSTSSAQCIQLCESMRAQMSGNENLIWNDDFKTTNPTAIKFCSSLCDKQMDCQVRQTLKDPLTSDKTIKATCS